MRNTGYGMRYLVLFSCSRRSAFPALYEARMKEMKLMRGVVLVEASVVKDETKTDRMAGKFCPVHAKWPRLTSTSN